MVSATEPRLFCVPPPPADDETGPRWNPPDGAPPGPWTVETAYRYCERMATTHYENFPVASRFLPSHLRPNVMAIYAYARTADDFADEPRYENRRVESLDRWEQLLEAFAVEATKGNAQVYETRVDVREGRQRFSANFTKKRLQGVAPMAVAAGSQLAAALLLALPALWWWPAALPSAHAWAMVALLALLCTGLAYLLYFRLIAHVGAANAIAVTFLIPAFAVLWGWLFLAEALTPAMAIGCAVILLGTALATGVLAPRRLTPAAKAR